MADRFSGYGEFWAHYLRQHGRPATRALHYAGTLLALACLALGLTVHWTFLVVAPLAGYGFAWLAHFLIEGNRPATFGHPLWSVLSDVRMLGLAATGRLRSHLDRAGLCLLLLFGVAGAAAAAEEGKVGTFSVLIENDKFTGTDRYYTSGTKLSWLSAPAAAPGWLRGLADIAAPILRPGSDLRWGLALGHNIFTPQDTDRRVPDPRDHPYAGWLYGAISLVSYTEEEMNTLELSLGMVGPSALGEPIQNGWHELIGVAKARGWDHQIKDEFGAMLIAERKWRRIKLVPGLFGLEVDATPHVAAALGNVQTYASAGLALRFGDDLKHDFGPPRIRPALAGSAFIDHHEGFGWYLFAGVDGRLVLRDIFIEGNTWRDSAGVDAERLVGEAQLGFALLFGTSRLTYTHVLRSREFEGQRDPAQFGAISLSVGF